MEIEAKLKVDSHEEIVKRLVELGAEFMQEQLQTDYYLDDANRSLTETDRCLRLRRLLKNGPSLNLFHRIQPAKK